LRVGVVKGGLHCWRFVAYAVVVFASLLAWEAVRQLPVWGFEPQFNTIIRSLKKLYHIVFPSSPNYRTPTWGLVARKARWGGLKEARGGRCAANIALLKPYLRKTLLSCRSLAFCAFRLSRLQPPKKQNPLSENLRLEGWRPPAAGFTLCS
jgi:hypothetical protein